MSPRALVFVARGCPACHDFVPRFRRVAERLGVPYSIGDIATNPGARASANRFGINATPTTVTRGPRGGVHKSVGAVSDAEIAKLLQGGA